MAGPAAWLARRVHQRPARRRVDGGGGRARRKKLEGAKGLQVHHFEGGKVSETWLTAEDTYLFDEFWS